MKRDDQLFWWLRYLVIQDVFVHWEIDQWSDDRLPSRPDRPSLMPMLCPSLVEYSGFSSSFCTVGHWDSLVWLSVSVCHEPVCCGKSRGWGGEGIPSWPLLVLISGLDLEFLGRLKTPLADKRITLELEAHHLTLSWGISFTWDHRAPNQNSWTQLRTSWKGRKHIIVTDKLVFLSKSSWVSWFSFMQKIALATRCNLSKPTLPSSSYALRTWSHPPFSPICTSRTCPPRWKRWTESSLACYIHSPCCNFSTLLPHLHL